MWRKSRGRRAWEVVRLALVWARRGRNRVQVQVSLLQKGMRKLRHQQQPQLVYGERELSFEATPVIHVKMHRPSSLPFNFKMPHIQMPCIKPPHLDFDFDYDCDFHFHDEIYAADEDDNDDDHDDEDDAAIDLKAEEFIANFYKQMKLQRQISIVSAGVLV